MITQKRFYADQPSLDPSTVYQQIINIFNNNYMPENQQYYERVVRQKRQRVVELVILNLVKPTIKSMITKGIKQVKKKVFKASDARKEKVESTNTINKNTSHTTQQRNHQCKG